MKTSVNFLNNLLFVCFVAALLFNCSSSSYFKVDDIQEDQSIRLYLKNGEAKEGIIIDQDEEALTFVDSKDHQPIRININQIHQVKYAKQNFDYNGHPISEAEIAKHKKNRNAWGYAVGGAAVGTAIGLAIATPIWLSNDNPPPLFGAGLGLVVGSIYFGSKGIKKDRETAIRHVREMRGMETQLARDKAAEELRLKEIEKEKQELLKQLEAKKKRQNDSDNQD